MRLESVMWSWLLVLSGAGALLAQDLEQKLQTASEEGTITITKEHTGPYRPTMKPQLNEVNQAIIKQTNTFRKSHELQTLEPDSTLQQTAQSFAEYMARTGRYGHEADDRTAKARAEEQGYEICFIAENIAMQFKENGFSTGALTKAFVQGWKNSPGHRANMLRPEVTQTGVAVAQSAETGAYFAVQLFGRPQSQAIVFEVANQVGEAVRYKLGEQTFDLEPRLIRRHMMCSEQKLVVMQGEESLAETTPQQGRRLVITAASDSFEAEWEEAQLSPAELRPEPQP